MENEKKNSRVVDYFNKAKKILFAIILISFGYALCEGYHYTKKPPEKIRKTRGVNQTSVAINERGELLIVDRLSGDYEIFQDSVGMSIFHLYISSMQSTYGDKK